MIKNKGFAMTFGPIFGTMVVTGHATFNRNSFQNL